MTAIAPYLWYPMMLALAICGFAALLGMGAPVAAAAYLPVAFVGVTILALERFYPERLLWQPRGDRRPRRRRLHDLDSGRIASFVGVAGRPFDLQADSRHGVFLSATEQGPRLLRDRNHAVGAVSLFHQ